MKRFRVANKRRASKRFNRQAKKTKARNLFRGVMRGGYRL